MLFQDLPPIRPQPKDEKLPHPRPWRKGSVFDRGGEFRRAIDRNDRARIISRAESLERQTKAKGQRDGVIGQSGLALLRVLLFHFLNHQTSQLDPSYKQIRAQTGFCMETISQALKRLERAGVLDITRRIIRVSAKVWDVWTNCFVWRDRVQQDTNAYRVNFPTPDQQAFGDLAMPLLRPKEMPLCDSASQRESTPRFFSKGFRGKQGPGFVPSLA